MSSSLTLRKIYRSPVILAAITFAGLLFALFGDGIWDEISWAALAIPLLVVIWKIANRNETTHIRF